MTNLTIFNGENSQEITLAGLVDASNAPVTSATITAELTRAGVALPNGNMTFEPVVDTPGNYTAMLSGFNAPAGPAALQLSGSNAGVDFNLSVFLTIASRSM